MFNRLINEKFAKLRDDLPIQTEVVHRTPNKQEQNRNSQWYVILKSLNIQNKETILKAASEINTFHIKENPLSITQSFYTFQRKL